MIARVVGKEHQQMAPWQPLADSRRGIYEVLDPLGDAGTPEIEIQEGFPIQPPLLLHAPWYMQRRLPERVIHGGIHHRRTRRRDSHEPQQPPARKPRIADVVREGQAKYAPL